MIEQPDVDWRIRAETAEDFIRRQGYKRCDIAACNCGSWHGGRSFERLGEIRDALEEAGVSVNGRTILDAVKSLLPDDTASVPLLRIPTVSRSVPELLGVARRLGMPHAVLIGQRENGNYVMLTTDLSSAEANWMIDKLKAILLGPVPEHV